MNVKHCKKKWQLMEKESEQQTNMQEKNQTKEIGRSDKTVECKVIFDMERIGIEISQELRMKWIDV